jgi:hypothetical protein
MKTSRTIGFLGALAIAAAFGLAGCADDKATTCTDGACAADKACTGDAKSCEGKAASSCCPAAKAAETKAAEGKAN